MSDAVKDLGAVPNEALRFAFSKAGFSLAVSCKEAVIPPLGRTFVSIYGIYKLSKIFQPAIMYILQKIFNKDSSENSSNGPSNEVSNVREGSFAFDLSCFTEDQFKEVWEDYQSGGLLQRFQDEFEAHDIKVEGLQVEIKNLKEVKEKMEIIYCRSRNTKSENPSCGMQQDESEAELVKISRRRDDTKKEVSNTRSESPFCGIRESEAELVKMSRKLDNIEENQLEIKSIIREIRQNVVSTPARLSRSESFGLNYDIIVWGGRGTDESDINVVEKLSLNESGATWEILPKLKSATYHSTAVVIDSIIYVIGGSDIIEYLDYNGKSQEWKMSNVKLPFAVNRQTTVMHNGKIILIGGYNKDEETFSKEIMEISLSEPYQCKPLCDLPKAIGNHGSEKVDDKVFIFGGKDEKKTYDDVVLFDLATNKCEIISKLKRPLRSMGTVRCEHKIMLIGGKNENGFSHEVFEFDIKTNVITSLPRLNNARRGCAAVANGDEIIVMGGLGRKGPTRSVKSYNLKEKIWRPMSSLKKARGHTVAVICTTPNSKNARRSSDSIDLGCAQLENSLT
ncbi:kelch-like protein 12 [Xenia sp. Carnegie-2017]|uniref:kelch-like protein 12 n=1 Tax=Xenia sp. Carnegie-2017 TaxID=2897299 RepID=UPI001F034F5F|nr:kelch-like protein 12 [Xenia sp. Carnegie-2017]XP_046856656.1 kelch-like protein 12 [Xenia sp. Carnegie-2017]